MRIRRFVGNDFKETLALVKKELGSDAVIMSSRTIKTGFGLGRKKVEITAALDYKQPPQNVPTARQKAGEGSPFGKTLDSAIYGPSGPSGQSGRSGPSGLYDLYDSYDVSGQSGLSGRSGAPLPDNIERILDEVRTLRGELLPLIRGGAGGSDAHPLVRRGIDETLAAGLVERARGDARKLREAIAQDFKAAPPLNGRRVCIFTGPTGVGKTTTLAKMAAGCAMEGRKVMLTTFDVFRPGAEAQLRFYAERLNMPFRSLATITELFNLLTHTNDTIFVDTPGRSPKDKGFIEGLLSFRFTDMPMNTCLLLGAEADPEANMAYYGKYEGLGIDSLIFTKVDEGVRFGSIYNVAVKSGKPVSHITNGQSVPGDIVAPTGVELADLILGGSKP
jgi:flagellar biosynthesis protein FlhF